VVERLKLLLCVREVPGSNLSRRPVVVTEDFSAFPQSLRTDASTVS
jgi:hypothetical protein